MVPGVDEADHSRGMVTLEPTQRSGPFRQLPCRSVVCLSDADHSIPPDADHVL